ncbi:MAG: hypothetical protein H6835_14525 [Planctomycetes bacterium]|nr:hypothetical protein [Planctomycetota bacterium]
MQRSVILSAVLSLAVTATAQSWGEIGDAGDLPATAQVVAGTGTLTSLAGTLASGADMYLIEVRDSAAFVAEITAGTMIDPIMCLFDDEGRAVVFSDDSPGSFLPRITGSYVPAPGRYYLAIAGYGSVPIAANGLIFQGVGFQFEPSGAGRRECITAWLGTSSQTGTYHVSLQGAGFVQERVVVPADRAFGDNAEQLLASGSTAFFAAGPRRFQLLYNGSHFTAAGVTGPITIRKLLFRAEDGEANGDAAAWTNVTVRLGRTSLWPGGMSSLFGYNLQAANGTILGPQGAGTVKLQPARGSFPNTYNVELDLEAMGAMFAYDPAGLEPNLLVDITLPVGLTTPSGGAVVAMQDADVGNGAGMAVAGAAGSTVGTFASPLVMAVEYAGGNGDNRDPVAARNERVGAGSGGAASSFYQAFANGQAFDMTGLRLVRSPSGDTYDVQANAAAVDLSKLGAAPVSTGDDQVVNVPLSFWFAFPGGGTFDVDVGTNGFVCLTGSNPPSDYVPSVAGLLGTTTTANVRLAPCWHDFHCGRNVATHPNSGLHVFTDTSGGAGHAVLYVTWFDVAEFNQVAVGGINAFTMQCVLHEDSGDVEFRYGTMPAYCTTTGTSADALGAIVGFSRGRWSNLASVDPGSRDLSLELPFSTKVEGAVGNMRLRAVAAGASATYGARLFPGNVVHWEVDGVPAGAQIGVQLLDAAALRPGLQLPGITAPATMLSTTTSAVLWEIDLLPASTQIGSNTLVVPAGLDGVQLYAQYVVLDGLLGGPALITCSSDTLRHTIGRR